MTPHLRRRQQQYLLPRPRHEPHRTAPRHLRHPACTHCRQDCGSLLHCMQALLAGLQKLATLYDCVSTPSRSPVEHCVRVCRTSHFSKRFSREAIAMPCIHAHGQATLRLSALVCSSVTSAHLQCCCGIGLNGAGALLQGGRTCAATGRPRSCAPRLAACRRKNPNELHAHW